VTSRSIVIGNNTLTIATFLFSRPLLAPPHACTANFCVFCFYRPTGRPRRTSLSRNVIATQQLGHVQFSPRGLLSETEKQSRTRGGQSRRGVVVRLVHTRLGSSYLIAHALVGQTMGGRQGAGDGVPERRLVFARDHVPQAWQNLQPLVVDVAPRPPAALSPHPDAHSAHWP
jgi:hypothetical protein